MTTTRRLRQAVRAIPASEPLAAAVRTAIRDVPAEGVFRRLVRQARRWLALR